MRAGSLGKMRMTYDPLGARCAIGKRVVLHLHHHDVIGHKLRDWCET
jgi:hypothetical protein